MQAYLIAILTIALAIPFIIYPVLLVLHILFAGPYRVVNRERESSKDAGHAVGAT